VIKSKLIRDHIATDIARNEPEARLEQMQDDTYRAFLTMKLVEEAAEFEKVVMDYGFVTEPEGLTGTTSYTKTKRLGELADVLEVVRSLAEADGRTLEDVVVAADHKRNTKGAFKGHWLLTEKWTPDRSPRSGLVAQATCDVSFDGDIQVTTDGRKRGLWVWIRNAAPHTGKDEETAVLLVWSDVSRVIKLMAKAVGGKLEAALAPKKPVTKKGVR
jgi:predicted house-cleaning noncanonical NTP pyrophosphatase (MazG superfamily)